MRRLARSLCTLGFAVAVTSPAQAQASIFVGAGLTFPIGDYGEYAKSGWLANAGMNVPLGDKGAWIGGELIYGSNSHSDIDGDKTNLPGILANLGYRFGDRSKPGPYVYGAAGVVNHQYKSSAFPTAEGSEWGFAYGAGAGVDIPAGGVTIWIEGRFIGRSDTNLFPIMAGVSIPVGKRN